jgi:hypothetical protein
MFNAVELSPAPVTEALFFLVKVLHISTRPHDADRVVAMDQTEGMAQLMGDHFTETLDEQLIVGFEAIMLIPEAVEGGNPRISVQPGLAENIGEYGNIEIDPHHADHLDGIRRSLFSDHFQQSIGIILPPGRIVESTDVKVALLQDHGIMQLPGDILCNPSGQLFLEEAAGNQYDGLVPQSDHSSFNSYLLILLYSVARSTFNAFADREMFQSYFSRIFAICLFSS